ncbi:MAG: hypothetical protein M9899_07255 [Bdellovibrionaceae bacterium]|nr:hypothetical protein [Pseudobdellovibrionaceae bacterium]
MYHFLKLIIGVLFLHVSAYGFVKDPAYDEYEGYELVDMLIEDKRHDLALLELQKSTIQAQNPQRYLLLQGKWYFSQNQWESAIGYFKQLSSQASLKYLGRSYFQMKNYSLCLDAYNKASHNAISGLNSSRADLIQDDGTQHVWISSWAYEDVLMYSECAYQVQNYEKSFAMLNLAIEATPVFELAKARVELLLKLGLYRQALGASQKWLEENLSTVTECLSLIEQFYKKSLMDETLMLLEMSRVRFPQDLDINLTFSQILFQKRLLLSAEEGFARAALTDRQYFYHAAEINRQIKKYQRAQFLNSFIGEETERLKQRVATYVDMNKYSLLASLEPTISRSDLIKDDEVKYALAYSLISVGQVEEPLGYLVAIEKPELLEKSILLRKTLSESHSKEQKSSF